MKGRVCFLESYYDYIMCHVNAFPKNIFHFSLPCNLIYVHLPFDQHSRLEVRAGQTARDAISKLLKKRNITPQLCHVNVSEDPRSEQIDLNVSSCQLVFSSSVITTTFGRCLS